MDADEIDCGTARALVPSAGGYSLELAISLWLHAKATSRSQSERTRDTYDKTLTAFRRYLHRHGLDLDAQAERDEMDQEKEHPITTMAQAWASAPRADGAPVTASTTAQRLAVLSSFFTFCRKRQIQSLRGANPISLVERPSVQRYAGARPLDRATVAERLAAIDRRTLRGLRDYALLSLALETGRRLSELGALDARHVTLPDHGERAVVNWPRAKYGRQMRDRLTPATTGAILAWLLALHGAALDTLAPEQALWVSLAHNGTGGHRLSRQHIEKLCAKRMGTSKLHALRHTFAVEMERAGAQLTDIQHRLGHANAATTGLYLNALKSADNPYADQLAAAFGIGNTPAKAPTRGGVHR
jgi:integrase/recombinase XerD